MENGNLIKEKFEYLKERFSTQEGWADFLVGTFIWGFLIVKFNNIIFNYFYNKLEVVKFEILRKYFSYLLLGIFFSALGLGISVAIIKLFKLVKKKLRK